ncbi:MAG TPA: hypothetical protein VMU81_28240 [Acetobacteraceae bacterium]|jgi:hypothetical protein|nr:hypothetical protein [Acetobacteraceae bacterium]
MRKTLLAAAVAFVVGGASIGSLMTYAQPAPPVPAADGGPAVPGPHPGMDGPGWNGPMMGPMAWMRRWHEWHHRPALGTFALVYPQKDRNLNPADVQKIAEAFLLWHGNHTWKVVNVAATPEGPIAFSLATPDGTVIASFTMNPHTGRIERTS